VSIYQHLFCVWVDVFCTCNFLTPFFHCQDLDELEEIAAAHEAGIVEEESDDEEMSEEAKKERAEARMREEMADMGFDT